MENSAVYVSLVEQCPVHRHYLKSLCRAQELCESGGGRPGLPSLISLRGRKATLNNKNILQSSEAV